jgi:hypothetical protein
MVSIVNGNGRIDSLDRPEIKKQNTIYIYISNIIKTTHFFIHDDLSHKDSQNTKIRTSVVVNSINRGPSGKKSKRLMHRN